MAEDNAKFAPHIPGWNYPHIPAPWRPGWTDEVAIAQAARHFRDQGEARKLAEKTGEQTDRPALIRHDDDKAKLSEIMGQRTHRPAPTPPLPGLDRNGNDDHDHDR